MYQFLKKIVGFLFCLIYPLQVSNLPEIDPNKRLIVCANHISMRDIVALAAAYPHTLHFVAKDQLGKLGIISRIFVKAGVIFIDREGTDIDAVRKTISVLNENQQIGIFPEGTRVSAVDPQNMKPGIGFIALRAKSDVLCAFIDTKYQFRKPVRVSFRPLLSYQKYEEMDRRIARRQFSADIFNAIYGTNYSLSDFRE